jgi:demethoxyubiquinone hydroxylase (CLK1/Coq7/Cat5 family)
MIDPQVVDPATIKELKIMHACELGAVGVYRGHKCVARHVFRQAAEELDHMKLTMLKFSVAF